MTIAVLKATAIISAIYVALVLVGAFGFATVVWIADALKRRRK